MNKDHKYKIHGDNISKKLNDSEVINNKKLGALIKEISKSYESWVEKTLLIDNQKDLSEKGKIIEKIKLFDDYRIFLDEDRFDVFDSRGALQSSALEEFCYYLLRPIFVDFEGKLALGHHLVYQSLYFTSNNIDEFIDFPTPNYPVNNLDFIIGIRVDATLKTKTKQQSTPLYIPVVAIECKTYLDRPRFIESDLMAKNIKVGFPSCLYILLSEFLKLNLNSVNIQGSEIDRIYVIRRKHNIDRKIRRKKLINLEPIHPEALEDLYFSVKEHLTKKWDSTNVYETGILKSE